MWSRFEKLKDNITQIASDVLDNQDDDYDLDGEEALDDDSFDQHYNVSQYRQDSSDGEDESPEFRPTQEKRNGHVDVVREQPRVDIPLVDRTDPGIEKVSEDHYIATNGFDTAEKITLEVNSLNGKEANGRPEDWASEHSAPAVVHGLHESALLLSELELHESEFKSNEPEALEDSSHKYSDDGFSRKGSLGDFSQKGSLGDSSRKDSHEEFSHTNSLEGFSQKVSEASHDVSSEKEVHASRALAEQVKSLSERLRASEDVCSSLQTKLDTVSVERDTISKRLEEVLLAPGTLSKKLEEVLLERDSLSKKVEGVSLERDKAVQNLGRLRQNLLDMESSTSDKMDNDSILIEDLQLRLKTAEESVSQLQQALAISQDDLAEANRSNVLRSMGTSEEMEILNQRLEACSQALESKDIELANLQSALGQYYAESDAQDRVESELRAVRELNTRLTRDLKIAEETMDLKAKELERVTQKLTSADTLNAELKHTMHKMQQDVLKLRAALEQSITSLNRMSSDSDFYVDRRIVIKLLVTYFQRHHSREVLDLMVRMLGFSEEDKRRVGMAQQNARSGGMVRSVFGVPGRIVGGILGSSDPDASPRAAPGENQSFADMWIDFLLKESQERERRERGEGGVNPVPVSPMANITRSMPSSPSAGGHHKPSSSFSGFPSSFLLPPKPSRVSSSADLETILTGNTPDDASS